MRTPVVAIVPAADETIRDAIRGLYPDYLESISPFTNYYLRKPDGSWVPDWLGDWFEDPLRHSHLITANGAPAGVAFMSEAPFEYQTSGCDVEIREFYVAPAFQQMGVGRLAAHACFEQFSAGRPAWALTVLEQNDNAHRFWRKVLAGAAAIGVTGVVEAIEPDSVGVTTFRFRVNRAQ